MVPVDALTAAGDGTVEVIAPQTMAFGKSRRPFDFHKGQAGRVAVIAGSTAYPGAAVLAATGALRGGAGLITLYVPQQAYAVVAAKCPPEIIVRGGAAPAKIDAADIDALVIGCGLGEVDTATADWLEEIITTTGIPAIIDADALNWLARSGMTGALAEHHAVTPHPGEFRRLAPDLTGLPQEEAARAFAARSPATLLLKGCRTLITRRDHPLWCNTTGHPGMATGGQGDLLAGVIGALLAAGHPPPQAAALAAWLCGRSAEIAVNSPQVSPESLTPSDVAAHLGAAFRDWQESRR